MSWDTNSCQTPFLMLWGLWDLGGICVFFLVLVVHYCCTQVLSLPTKQQQLHGEINSWGGQPTCWWLNRGAKPAWGRLVPLRWRGHQHWQQSGAQASEQGRQVNHPLAPHSSYQHWQSTCFGTCTYLNTQTIGTTSVGNTLRISDNLAATILEAQGQNAFIAEHRLDIYGASSRIYNFKTTKATGRCAGHKYNCIFVKAILNLVLL